MPEKLSQWINNHQFPSVYYRFPGLLRLQWFTNRILYHRNWLIRRALRRCLRKFSADFTFMVPDAAREISSFPLRVNSDPDSLPDSTNRMVILILSGTSAE
jgi:hypothetical protein